MITKKAKEKLRKIQQEMEDWFKEMDKLIKKEGE
jgi:hypothetical protein